MSTRTDFLCPKDQSPMRVVERNGVVIERCMECGGIFLDRGELERLMRAEGEYVERNYRGFRDDDDDDYDRDTHHQGRPRKKKRRGFLEDLLDFG